MFSCRQIECHYCYLDYDLGVNFKMAVEKHHNHTESEIVYMQTQ